jgi:hypothetical protein
VSETVSIRRQLAAPLARLSPRNRARLAITAVTVGALVFPILNGNDADIDSAANALAFAALALGLNIVVGMAGLLDLGYAAFFAIGGPDPAPQGRLSGDRDLGVWRDRADRRAQHAVGHQWCNGVERSRGPAALRL